MSGIILGGGINTDAKRKFLDDGSEWERIFWHDVSTSATYFSNSTEVKNCTLSNRYSRLDTLNNFFYNGKYEFMLCYPKHSTTKYNRWIQTADPLTVIGNATQTATTMGYKPVHIDFTTNWKYGFGLSTSTSTYMDCEAGHTNWFGAIGQYKAYSSNNISGFPAPTETGMNSAQKEVELWVRIHRDVRILKDCNNQIVYIKNKDDFLNFCSNVNKGNTYEGKKIFLLTDISTSGASEHVDFSPVGNNTHPFKGTFDGQGHTLNITYIDNTGDLYDYVGFIGYNEGIIRNLRVTNMYMRVSKYGGLICAYNSGIVEQCQASGSILDSDNEDNSIYAGGVVGDNVGKVMKCISSANFSISTSRAATDCGGIVGHNSGEVISCRNTGSISGYTSGGIVGWNYVIGSVIKRCVNFGSVDGVWSGGIAGYVYRGEVDSCLNAGNGAGAGIIGMSEYGTANNCYYASDYNSSGMAFTDTGHTDTTTKISLSSMKSDSMVQKLGKSFFFYDTSWDNWINARTKQFIKFNWENVLGWANGEDVSNDDFNGGKNGDSVNLTIDIAYDWNSSEGLADEFELLLEGKLCRAIKKPTRKMQFILYPSDGIIENTFYNVTGRWIYYKNGSTVERTVRLDTYGGVACFEEGTMILTSNGLKPIELIKEEDLVLSKNEKTGQIEEQKVYHIYNHKPRSCL